MIKYNHYMIYEGKNILFELTNLPATSMSKKIELETSDGSS